MVWPSSSLMVWNWSRTAREFIGIEIGTGFVGKEDDGAVHHAAGNRHPLLLASGELFWQVVEPVGKTDGREHLPACLSALVIGLSLRHCGEHATFSRTVSSGTSAYSWKIYPIFWSR